MASTTMTRTKISKPKSTPSPLAEPRSPLAKMWESAGPAARPLPRAPVSRARKRAGSRAYPALQLAPHDMRNHRHAGFAVVEAGNRGEVLAPRVVENLGVFAGDLLQRLEAIGGKSGRHDREILAPPL